MKNNNISYNIQKPFTQDRTGRSLLVYIFLQAESCTLRFLVTSIFIFLLSYCPNQSVQDEGIIAILVLEAQNVAQVLLHNLVHLFAKQLSYYLPSQVNNRLQASVGRISIVVLPLKTYCQALVPSPVVLDPKPNPK